MATVLRMRLRDLLLLGAGAIATTVARQAAPLQAQIIDVRPVADVSLPTRISFRDGSIHVSQKVGLSFGARMMITFSDRFDVGGAISYSPGSATLHGVGKKIDLRSASQSLAGASSARYWIRPPGRPFSWEVHTGVGMVFGGQASYMDLLDGSTLSAVLGTAFRYQIGQLVSLTLRAQQRLLRLQFGDHEGRSSSRPFSVAFAVGFPFLEQLH
jgi:hypothetical protein